MLLGCKLLCCVWGRMETEAPSRRALAEEEVAVGGCEAHWEGSREPLFHWPVVVVTQRKGAKPFCLDK